MSGQDSTPRADAEPAPSAKDYAATHPIVCAHADEDGQGSHILAPGEQCNRSTPVSGPIPPLKTKQQARDLPAVRAVYEKISEGPLRPGRLMGHNMRMLQDALNAAGVKLGPYDVRILQWLAGWEPETCGVVASLIARAAEGKS